MSRPLLLLCVKVFVIGEEFHCHQLHMKVNHSSVKVNACVDFDDTDQIFRIHEIPGVGGGGVKDTAGARMYN